MRADKKSLIIMAAGLGSRYGGNKQVDRIGPDGEILMQYSLFDAINAGFNKIIFIIKPEYQGLIDELSADAKLHGIEIFTAYQSFESIPDFYNIPKDRIKPFGTVHAVLSAKDIVNEPFAIINADDFYGRDAFCVMSKALDNVSDNCGAMVAYKLKNTVSKNGSVTRGVCKTQAGMLTDIIETQNISLLENGDIIDEATGKLDSDIPVSMNMWGFTPYILRMMENSFSEFLKALESDDIRSEYPIPSFVGKKITDGELSIKVFTTVSEWFGVTYIEDRPFVEEQLNKFKEDEIYPQNLKL